MKISELFVKQKLQAPFAETTFECKRGAHGFSEKHATIAMAHLRRFIGGDKT